MRAIPCPGQASQLRKLGSGRLPHRILVVRLARIGIGSAPELEVREPLRGDPAAKRIGVFQRCKANAAGLTAKCGISAFTVAVEGTSDIDGANRVAD